MDNKEKSFLSIIDKHLNKFFDDHQGGMPESGLYKRIISEVETLLITNTLKVVVNNQSKAAKILGLNRNTLRKKIQELNIKV
jgi:two-component system nitrogen regulation response regulator GlnG